MNRGERVTRGRSHTRRRRQPNQKLGNNSVTLSKLKKLGPRRDPEASTEFYRVLPSLIGLYRVLPSFTEFYRVLPSFPVSVGSSVGQRNSDLDASRKNVRLTCRPRLRGSRPPNYPNRLPPLAEGPPRDDDDPRPGGGDPTWGTVPFRRNRNDAAAISNKGTGEQRFGRERERERQQRQRWRPTEMAPNMALWPKSRS